MKQFCHCLNAKKLSYRICEPKSAKLGFWDIETNEHFILDHLPLVFKMYPCDACEKIALT